MMPKAKGDPYFISCRKGAEEAAQELGIDLLWDGPTDLDTAKQNEVVEGWITRGVDVIAVSVENQAAISTVLRKARKQGIKVLDLGCGFASRRSRLPDQSSYRAGDRLHAGRSSRSLSRRERRIRHRHRSAQRRQSEHVDRSHTRTHCGGISGREAGDRAAERR